MQVKIAFEGKDERTRKKHTYWHFTHTKVTYLDLFFFINLSKMFLGIMSDGDDGSRFNRDCWW